MAYATQFHVYINPPLRVQILFKYLLRVSLLLLQLLITLTTCGNEITHVGAFQLYYETIL